MDRIKYQYQTQKRNTTDIETPTNATADEPTLEQRGQFKDVENPGLRNAIAMSRNIATNDALPTLAGVFAAAARSTP